MKKNKLSFVSILILLIALPSFARGKADKSEEVTEIVEPEEISEETETKPEKELVEAVGTTDIIKDENSGSEERLPQTRYEESEQNEGGEQTNGSESDENNREEPKLAFPAITEKPFVIFNEGVAYSMVTRLIYQDKYSRSNFVWQNHLIGAYCEIQSVNIRPVDSILRVAAYYPFYYTFNGMEQPAKQAILYAFDLFWGPIFQTDMWKYVYINFAFGPHFLYQLSDEYHHVELGAGVLLGVELPLARRWTILTNGLASLDYGNLGSNKHIQPYNLVYNFQIELGVRYSKKKQHQYSYLGK